MAEPEIKRRKTFNLRLTRFELLHLRDLFSVMLATEMKTTVSQALAASQERVLIESKLWQKVASACQEAELPTDDEAPDFVVAASSTPAIGVFQLAHEPAAEDPDEDEDAGKLFADKEEEE